MSKVKPSSVPSSSFKAERVQLRTPAGEAPSPSGAQAREETDHYFAHQLTVTETVDGRTATLSVEEQGHETLQTRVQIRALLPGLDALSKRLSPILPV